MLVGRRMVHDVGTVFFKHRLDPVGVPDGADAVSYTHLDVYKRQEIGILIIGFIC